MALGFYRLHKHMRKPVKAAPRIPADRPAVGRLVSEESRRPEKEHIHQQHRI